MANTDIQAQYDELKKQHDALQLEHSGLSAEFETLKKVNENLTQQVEDLSKAKTAVPEQKTAATSSAKTFKLNGIEYGFAYPKMKHQNAVITADDVLADADLQKKLVAMGSGFIVKK